MLKAKRKYKKHSFLSTIYTKFIIESVRLSLYSGLNSQMRPNVLIARAETQYVASITRFLTFISVPGENLRYRIARLKFLRTIVIITLLTRLQTKLFTLKRISCGG